MKKLRQIHELDCPSCKGQMAPIAIHCEKCQIRVEGNFVENEFSRLNQEQMHLLRIFLRCEGKVRDMESALGLSYPTIRRRIHELRRELFPVLGSEKNQ
jgi:hypothetical protein